MKPAPDRIYGPKIAALMLEFAREIYKECKASSIRITSEFKFNDNKGKLDLQTFITPDGTTERLMDMNIIQPRGSKLQHDVASKLGSVAKRVRGRKKR